MFWYAMDPFQILQRGCKNEVMVSLWSMSGSGQTAQPNLCFHLNHVFQSLIVMVVSDLTSKVHFS